MRKRFSLRHYAGLAAAVAALVIVPLAVAGAINTTTDPGQTVGTQTTLDCLNGPTPSVNCNLYQQKEDVFLSGSPIAAALGAGTYFFAVLAPGGHLFVGHSESLGTMTHGFRYVQPAVYVR